MPFRNTLVSFVIWFNDTFIQPIIDLLKSTDILGFSFFEWLMAFSVASLAIRFILDFFDLKGSD